MSLLLLTLVFGLGYLAGKKYDIAIDENDDYLTISYSVNEQKMRRLMSLIDNYYVEHINTDSLVDETINYVVGSLDPHSVYLNKKSSQEVSQEMKGYYVGIGMEYIVHKDTITVTNLSQFSPNLEKLEFGDRIYKVDDSIVIGISTEKLKDIILGKPNSTLNLKIIRNNQKKNIKVKRSPIITPSVPLHYMINKSLGYIKIKKFSENTYAEFHHALLDLKSKGMKTLVLDLRGNLGGILQSAEKIADEFLPKGKLLVYTQDNQGKKIMRYATERGDFENQPLYILIDELSASASEVIAGAIQDHDAGTIVGRRSFGKGLVQKEISLGDGSKIRLTTAKYYTPSGRSIQKPYDKGTQEYHNDIYKRFEGGELYSKDSISITDSTVYKTAKGKTVYGGGGIIPDIYIPIEEKGHGQWYYQHAKNNVIATRIFEFVESHKDSLKQLSKENFIQSYQTNDFSKQLLKDFKIPYKNIEKEEFENFNTYVKSTIGRFFYGEKTYIQVWNTNDNMIKAVLQQVKSK